MTNTPSRRTLEQVAFENWRNAGSPDSDVLEDLGYSTPESFESDITDAEFKKIFEGLGSVSLDAYQVSDRARSARGGAEHEMLGPVPAELVK